MNELEGDALEELVAEHRRLREHLDRLHKKIEKLRAKLSKASSSEPALPPAESIPAFGKSSARVASKKRRV